MLSLMALLDRKRTSDLKLLKEFDYPASTSKLVFDQELLEAFKECGEPDVRLLQEVRVVYPPLYSKFFESNSQEKRTKSSGESSDIIHYCKFSKSPIPLVFHNNLWCLFNAEKNN